MTNLKGGEQLRGVLVGGLLLGLAACAGGNADHECNDGLDNDDDGLFDGNDPGCLVNGTSESPDPDFPACSDGVDNDGDSLTDYPDDPGCDSAEDDDEYGGTRARCNDGIDNDSDGRIDYPYDPGCFSPFENDEEDDCPDGPDCPACSNGIDDDGDGRIDYGAAADNDPGCDRAADDDEFDADPGICGNVVVQTLPADGIVTGSATPNSTNELISIPCGGAGQESVYAVNLTQPTALFITTEFSETTLDTVVYVREECRAPATELGCNDDTEGVTSTLLVEVDPGVYYIIIDAHSASSGGNFKAVVTAYIPQGEPCDPLAPMCAPDLVCRMWDDSSTQETCEWPRCNDDADNDGDGFSDFPADPGCTDQTDNDETDDCPEGPGCPLCGNQLDDDGDGLTDYPDDPGCASASDDDENDCPQETDPIDPVVSATTTGTTVGLSNDLSPSCSSYSTAPDKVYLLSVPGALTSLTADTEGTTLDTVLYVKATNCESPDLGCDDDSGATAGSSLVQLGAVAAGNYFIIVDGYGSSTGVTQLNVHGVIAAGEPCDAVQIAAGIFDCDVGYSCQLGICELAGCNNGDDDDGDTLTDYPNDPGCSSPSDDDETDDCPEGPTCPQCSDEQDNDGDLLTDYGSDPGCAAAGDDNEIDECIPGVEVLPLDPAGSTGTTSGVSNFVGSCGYGSYPEDVYSLTVDLDLLWLSFSTIGSAFDTTTYVRLDDCSSTTAEVVCADIYGSGEIATVMAPITGATYFVFVDGYYASGDYILTATGSIAGGNPCVPGDLQFVCESGFYCDDTTETCLGAACNNGGDDDGDSLADYPFDPGCANISDNDETDDCPEGPTCPQCSNDIDDDGDGNIDWGADPGCAAASDNVEDDCPGESDPVLVVTAGAMTGTTVGLTDDFTPTCASSTAPEAVYSLLVGGKLVSLTIDTEGSALDTVVYLRAGECSSPEIDCDDEGGSSYGASLLQLTDVDPGSYLIFVDGWSTGADTYNLNVHGVIAGGQACDAAQIAAGIFSCQAGYACVTGLCAPAACNNGGDDDADGLADYPLDPGCASVSDDDETDDCPDGPTCPQCSNGIDDDGDTFVDYGSDLGCAAAGDDDENDCVEETDSVDPVTSGTMTGTTVGLHDDLLPSCTSYSTAPEKVYVLTSPGALISLTADTDGSAFDTVLYVKATSCSTADLDCDDEGGSTSGSSLVELGALPAGPYFIVVDGYSSYTGTYQLNVHGVIAADEPCDAAQVAAGIFSCETGFACQGGFCAPAACNDGDDDDGDTLIDYPDDPGCDSPSDGDETDDCPSGPTCPQCSNGIDDDGDTFIDYPDDTGCIAASGDLELNCADADGVVTYTASPTTGTTSGATDDFLSSCQTYSTAPDRVFYLPVPGTLDSLSITTDGSAFDTVLMVKQSVCTAADYGCDDDGGSDLQSLISLTAVPAGDYFVIVDGYSSNAGAYTLTIAGVIASGQPCDPAQAFFTCAAGTTCTNPGSGYLCN